MQNQPIVLLVMIGIGTYVTKLWVDDYRAQQKGVATPNALPGATHAPAKAILIAISGAILLLAAETWGEHLLGITAEQSKMTALFALYTLIAAVIEEIIFRGYLVIRNKGRLVLWLGVFAASALFALLHPFLWTWHDDRAWSEGKLALNFSSKAWFSTGAIFAGSLWFYFVRLAAFNPNKSLMPCFAAHAAKNAGVIIIKASTGFLSGWL